jgi:tRNA pseudouridine38-40 synthase
MSNHFYLLKIQYEGTQYLGWQSQKPIDPTIQDHIKKVLQEISKSTEVKTVAAGRTDTGVHALTQYVKVEMPLKIDFHALKRGMNSLLPKDIRVVEVSESKLEFRPTNDAQSKTYFYLFSNVDNPTPFQKHWIPNIDFKLDLAKMQSAAKLFEGEHDFTDFFTVGSEINSSVRTIFKCSLEFNEKVNFYEILPPHYRMVIKGNGFLKQMVRLIMGAIWEVGRGKLSLEELERSLTRPIGKRLSAVAPPEGLFKAEVQY